MGEDGRWSVEVEAVEKRDGKWVKVGDVRQHATRPDGKRVIERAPVEEASHVEAGRIEETSPEVIRESVAKSADNTPLNYAEAKTALEGTDIGAIKSAMEKLGVESQALGQAIYEATQAEQAAGGGDSGGSSNDDVVDAEVVEDDQENK